MKTDARRQVHFLRDGLEKFLAEEEQHVANGAPRLRGEQFFALGALTKLQDNQIASCYYKLPTGFGKTVMFSYMAQAYMSQAQVNGDKKKLIILVPRLNLINQTGDKLDSFAGFSASEFSSRAKNADADIIISTYHSLDKLIKTIGIENIGIVFADEAHHATGTKTSVAMTSLMSTVPTIGFTATPSYDANKSVNQILDTEVFVMTIADGVRSGMLAPTKNILYCSSIVCDLEKAPATNHGEYDYNSIRNQIDIDTLANEIADVYISGADEDTGHRFIDCKTMINCPNIEMAEHQADAINKKAGRVIARAFSSEMKNFDAEKARFIAGEYRVACQVNTMTEGFDDTAVSLCINYPTRSAVRAEQAAGRAIRLHNPTPDKIAFIIDTVFKKYDGETSDTALETARRAKQVLFKDIAGGVMLFPEKTGTREIHEPKTYSTKKRIIKPYEIITSTETLMNLIATDNERVKSTEKIRKTSDWLNAEELTKYFRVGKDVILQRMNLLANRMHEYIQKRASRSAEPLCLHVDAIDMFARLSRLEKRVAIPEKTDEWLAAHELSEHLFGGVMNIVKGLKECANKMPNKIQIRHSGSSAIPLCLHISAIDEFAQMSGLQKRTFIPPKTDEWLNAREAIKYLHTNHMKILKKMNEFADNMPNKIQIRQTKGVAPLCIHINALDEFVQLAGLKKRIGAPKKTNEWLNADDLTEFFTAKRDKINITMKHVSDKMPSKIQLTKSGARLALCVHVSAIDEFARLSGLSRRVDFPPKTDEWLIAEELKMYFPGDRTKIFAKIKEMADKMPGKIQVRQSGSKTPLCLHVSAIKEFGQMTGLKLREETPPKTAEWLGADDLVAYFKGGRDKIFNKLNEVADKMPDKIQKRKFGAKAAICIHVSALDKFAQLTGLKRQNKATPEKFYAGVRVVNAVEKMAEINKQIANIVIHDKQYK